jgi:hypothetical protein
MRTVQKADPVMGLRAMLIVVVGTEVGTLLIIGFERYRMPFFNWLLSEPERLECRLGLF